MRESFAYAEREDGMEEMAADQAQMEVEIVKAERKQATGSRTQQRGKRGTVREARSSHPLLRA